MWLHLAEIQVHVFSLKSSKMLTSRTLILFTYYFLYIISSYTRNITWYKVCKKYVTGKTYLLFFYILCCGVVINACLHYVLWIYLWTCLSVVCILGSTPTRVCYLHINTTGCVYIYWSKSLSRSNYLNGHFLLYTVLMGQQNHNWLILYL